MKWLTKCLLVLAPSFTKRCNHEFQRSRWQRTEPSRYLQAKIEELEIDLDFAMKGRLIAVIPTRDEDVILIRVDTSDFIAHNDAYMQRNYYDKNGTPRLTAREANCWPKNEIHDIYVMETDDVTEYFEVEQ